MNDQWFLLTLVRLWLVLQDLTDKSCFTVDMLNIFDVAIYLGVKFCRTFHWVPKESSTENMPKGFQKAG